MHRVRLPLFAVLLGLALTLTGFVPLYAQEMSNSTATQSSWAVESSAKLEQELTSRYGEAQRARVQRGLRQVAAYWRAEDGDAAVFEDFVRNNFAGDQETLDAVFQRFESLLEKLFGHMQEIGREFRTQTDLDIGKVYPVDEIFAGYDPSAHVLDDFFQNKLAFIALLNFPLTTLEERLSKGEEWSRREWAEARLAQIFSKRVPAAVSLAIAQAAAEADQYISQYNIWMHHVMDDQGQRLFPPKMRLLSHWNLRDEIKANYQNTQDGLAKQRLIQNVMERIVTQTIPQAVVNNPGVDWNPKTNDVKRAAVKDSDTEPTQQLTNTPEPDRRYEVLLKTYQAARKADPYSPAAPTLIARRFDENREIPEARFRQMLVEVVSSPLVPRVAALIQKRLGRPLEPFDIWYSGFRAKSKYSEAELDGMVAKKYPTPDAYRQDIPNLLLKLGFSKERAEVLAANIVVDPARGSGHAMGAGMRNAKVRLRTRVEKTGMNYKGFNIAVHEMGHNVEQTFSMNFIDHTLLQGVPNTAFTEAMAFVFQARDLELLGLQTPDASAEALKTLNDFWATYEIAGVALVDMDVWHWMYDHPNATATELKAATLNIARGIWNQYYAPVFQAKDVVLLGIYSHMIDAFLYLPDYPLGHMIAFQIEEHVKKAGNLGAEFERMTTYGTVTPDLWMKHATGQSVGPQALLEATGEALATVEKL